MSKINETNYPRRTQANYADTDMLVIQAAGGNTYTTRLEDMREDYEETLAPTLSALQDDINENLATIEAGSTASKVYAKGDYLVFGGKLCRVTSTSIAAGATLTIGTNIELAPVGDELKTLSSDLTPQELYNQSHNYIVRVGQMVYCWLRYDAYANTTLIGQSAGLPNSAVDVHAPLISTDGNYHGMVALSAGTNEIKYTNLSGSGNKVKIGCLVYLAS